MIGFILKTIGALNGRHFLYHTTYMNNAEFDKIVGFIHRRFHEDNHWADGNCYWAAHILCTEFPNLKIFYCPVEGHFVTGILDGQFFDAYGVFDPKNDSPLDLDDIKNEDPLWFSHLMRDCRD